MSRITGILCGVLTTCVLASFASSAVVQASDQGRAVSKLNGKLSVEGGDFDSDNGGLARGSVTTPLGHAFGFQVDGDLGIVDNEVLGGASFHLFTRDPGRYLFGAFGSYHEWNGTNISRIGGEMELYRGRWTLSGIGGWESVDVPTTLNGLTVTNTDDDHFFTELDLSWYPKENLRITGGYHYENEQNLASGSIEYMPRWDATPAAIYANYDFGEDGYSRVVGGLRFYLNGHENKTLIRRQREDDPFGYLPVFPTIVTAANNNGATNFCPATTFFDLEENAGCTCPSGTDLAGGPPSETRGYSYYAKTVSYSDSKTEMPRQGTCENLDIN